MRLLITFLFILIPSIVHADELAGIGKVALNILEPVNIVSDFIGSASIIIGVTALFAALLRYMQYRVNPLAAPASSVVLLLIIGIVLLCLPFVYLLTEHGIPYTLLI